MAHRAPRKNWWTSAVIDYRDGHLQVITCTGSVKAASISLKVAALVGDGERRILPFTVPPVGVAYRGNDTGLRPSSRAADSW